MLVIIGPKNVLFAKVGVCYFLLFLLLFVLSLEDQTNFEQAGKLHKYVRNLF